MTDEVTEMQATESRWHY